MHIQKHTRGQPHPPLPTTPQPTDEPKIECNFIPTLYGKHAYTRPATGVSSSMSVIFREAGGTVANNSVRVTFIKRAMASGVPSTAATAGLPGIKKPVPMPIYIRTHTYIYISELHNRTLVSINEVACYRLPRRHWLMGCCGLRGLSGAPYLTNACETVVSSTYSRVELLCYLLVYDVILISHSAQLLTSAQI